MSWLLNLDHYRIKLSSRCPQAIFIYKAEAVRFFPMTVFISGIIVFEREACTPAAHVPSNRGGNTVVSIETYYFKGRVALTWGLTAT